MIQILGLFLAILIDIIVGDPPNRYHTTAWIGRFISLIKSRLKDKNPNMEKVKGTLGALLVISVVGITSYTLSLLSFDMIISIVASAIGLKMTIAIRSMEMHARRVIDAIDDLDIARKELSMIVGRDTSSLDKEHILSAVIESISENITDGITSSLFYYSLFGITGAFVYRTINTLDSMLGYKDEYHKNIGYFSANLDTIANYIPARLTAFVTILSAMLLKMEWRNALRIIIKDSKNTPSLNSGWSIAGVAGALKVRLEKIGYYQIGEPYEEITVEHCYKAIKMMKITVILFAVIVALPLLIIRVYIIGWDFI